MKRKTTTEIALQAAPQRKKRAAPTPRSGSPRLRTLDDVEVEMARVYREARRGEIPIADATRYTYMLTCIGKVIEAAEQPSRQQFANGTVVEVSLPTLADFYETVQTIPNNHASQPEKEFT